MFGIKERLERIEKKLNSINDVPKEFICHEVADLRRSINQIKEQFNKDWAITKDGYIKIRNSENKGRTFGVSPEHLRRSEIMRSINTYCEDNGIILSFEQKGLILDILDSKNSAHFRSRWTGLTFALTVAEKLIRQFRPFIDNQKTIQGRWIKKEEPITIDVKVKVDDSELNEAIKKAKSINDIAKEIQSKGGIDSIWQNKSDRVYFLHNGKVEVGVIYRMSVQSNNDYIAFVKTLSDESVAVKGGSLFKSELDLYKHLLIKNQIIKE